MDTNEEDDIYSDLPNFKYHETLDRLQATNKVLQSRVTELEEQVEILTKENIDYKEKCKNLSTNISSVLKTAQTEIKRKDVRISELNKEIITLKTRSFRQRRKRSLSGSPNKTNSERKKLKPSDLKDSPLSLRHSCKGSPSNVSIDTPPRETISSRVKRLPFTDSEIEKPNVPEPKLRVPNINCPTVYSQRMFKKIYNADPVNKITNDYGTSENETDIPSSNSKHIEEPSENPEPCIMSGTDDIVKDTTESKPQSSDNSGLPSVLAPTPDPQITTTTTTDSIIHDKEQIVQNIEKSMPNELISNFKTQFVSKNEGTINDESPTHSMNNTEKVSTNKSIPILPSVMQEIGMNIATKDLESIISNVKCFNLINDDKIKQPLDKTHTQENSATGAVKNLKKCSNPALKTDNILESRVYDTFGLKLTSRPNKTIFHPISGNWASKFQKSDTSGASKQQSTSPQVEKEENSDKTDVIEALFGSPLKWAENSADDLNQVPKLNPPSTAYEDSCSAQIENSKFKKLTIETSKVINNTLIKTSGTVTDSCTISMSNQHINRNKLQVPNEIGKIGETSSPRLFQQIKDDKNIAPKFSPFVNLSRGSEPFNVPSLSVKVDETSSQSPKSSRVFNPPKYNDSILGQFDDTTQLISALARDHSKISPIHTPIKESKSEAISSSPDSKSNTTKDETISVKSDNTPLLVSPPVPTKKIEKRTILLEKPINILRPRKTPRIVSGNKPPPVNSPCKISDNANGENTTSNAEPPTANLHFSNNQINAIKPPNIKLSSVSHEVIVRAKAINMGRKFVYKNTKVKCKIKEKSHTLKEKGEAFQNCPDSEIQSQHTENAEMSENLPLKQKIDEKEDSSIINTNHESTYQTLEQTSISKDAKENISTNEFHSTKNFYEAPGKSNDPVSQRKDFEVEKTVQNTFSPRIVELLQTTAKEGSSCKSPKILQTTPNLTTKVLHNSTKPSANSIAADNSKISEPMHLLNRNDIVPLKKENVSMESRKDHNAGTMSKNTTIQDGNNSSLMEQEYVGSGKEKQVHGKAMCNENINKTAIRSRAANILTPELTTNHKSHFKCTSSSEILDIKSLNTSRSKADSMSHSSSKTDNSSTKFSFRSNSTKRNENNTYRSHRDSSSTSSLGNSHTRKDNSSSKSSKFEAIPDKLNTFYPEKSKKNDDLCHFQRKDLTLRVLEKRERTSLRSHPYSSPKDEHRKSPIRSRESSAKKKDSYSNRSRREEDSPKDEHRKSPIRSRESSAKKKESYSNRSRREEDSEKFNRGNNSLTMKEDSPKFSRKENNDSASLNRSRSSSTKKENSPIKVRRIERDTKRTSNFKRPNNNFARYRENCRFRHSSVERKLLKDHRLSSRIRMTPVRVIKRQGQDLHSLSTNRSHSKENKTDHHSISNNGNSSKVDKDDFSTSKTFQTNSLNTENCPVKTSPFQLPSAPVKKTTHIKRTSRKIDWCSTTSDVISTKSVECTIPSIPKPETKMKWFLQPIDFNIPPPSAHPNSIDVSNRSKEYISSPSDSDCKILVNNSSKSLIDNIPEETKKRSPNIVIVARRRPVRFGVSDISVSSTNLSET